MVLIARLIFLEVSTACMTAALVSPGLPYLSLALPFFTRLGSLSPMSAPYNPLDKKNLGKSVVQALLDRPTISLKGLTSFEGAGVYAIYYSGDFPSYARLSAKNKKDAACPIYVGKAVPAGARKGVADDVIPGGKALYKRLGEHGKTIAEAKNLNPDHFICRYLTVDDVWIPLGETLLIQEFSPLWNVIVEGFGNHPPGGPREKSLRPVWDMMHPGRAWADRLPAQPLDRMAKIHASISDAMKRLK